MKVKHSIEKRIREGLVPMHLEVVNESHMHNVPEGAESHFKLVIVRIARTGSPHHDTGRVV